MVPTGTGNDIGKNGRKRGLIRIIDFNGTIRRK